MNEPDNTQVMSDEERAFAELTKDSVLADPGLAVAEEQEEQEDAEVPEKSEAAQTTEQQAPAEPFPGYAALPEEARKAFDTERAERERLAKEAVENLNKYRAVQGQNAPIQRQNEALRRQIQESETKAKEQAAKLEKWEKHKAEYPDEAAAIEEMIAPVRSDLESVRQENAQLHAHLQKQQTKAEIDVLSSAHSDWQDKVFGARKDEQKDPARLHEWFDPVFGEWFFAQHPNVQSLLGSRQAQDNIYLLDLYDRDVALAGLHEQPAAMPTPATDAVAARREKALSNTAPGIRSTQSGTRNAAALDDEEAAFAALTANNPLFS
jgi:hypothetical protein